MYLHAATTLPHSFPILPNEDEIPPSQEIPFLVDCSFSPLSYALTHYTHHEAMSGHFLSPVGEDDQSDLQEFQSPEPILHYPVLFENLADKFHGVLAWCMFHPCLSRWT
jgi:hypothetical protein